MYPTTLRTSALGQIDARGIGEGISHLFNPPEIGVLVDALTLLIRGFQVLADPAPKLAAGSLRTVAELHGVQRSAIGFNRHLAERAAKDLRCGGHGSMAKHDGTLISAPSVALVDQLQP